MSDLIERKDALTAVGEAIFDGRSWYDALVYVPSAEQEEFEWCYDCKEYDQNAHCCHRWTKCIRQTIDEIKSSQWIPCSERLPQTNVSILYCTNTGIVGEGRYEGYNGFHSVWKMYAICGTHWDNEVIAWCELPQPFKGDE